MWKGVFTPVITVFDKEGNLDLEGNEKILNRLVDSKVNGILVQGSIGEFFTLTMEEKKRFASFAIRTINHRIPVFIGTGGTCVDEVIELTRHAEREGADAAVVIAPYYFKLDEESMYRYYGEVAASVDMPIILYNFPDRTAVNMEPAFILRLAKDFPNIVGIKDTVDSINHTRKIIQIVKSELKDFRVYSGFDEYLLPNLMAAGDGVIGGLSNIAPEIFVEYCEGFRKKNFEQMAGLQKKVNILMNLYDQSQPFIPAVKEAVNLVVPGGISSVSRKPAGGLSKEQIERIRNILMQAGLLNG
ncbi:MAG: 4-hydroxy-tetrahydrodipicolinate synthase [Clostridia bacterium]